MKSEICEEDEDNILYELLIHTEWPLDPEFVGGDSLSQGGSIFYRTLMQTPSSLLSLASNIESSFWRCNSITPNLARILGSGSEWQLGVGAQGAVICVLQESSLEVRAKKDEYASVVGKNYNLYTDPFPKWRRVSWSSECSMVAVAYSSGAVEIFNTVGASLFTIYPPRFQEGKPQVDSSNALAALIFSDVRTEKIKWASELIMIDFYGHVRGYFVSPTEGYQESNSFSFHRLYPRGISAAVEIGSLVIVSGSCQYVNDSTLRNNGLGHGLSIWRMLNDYPYYKQVPTIDEDEYAPPGRSLLQRLPGLTPTPVYDCVFRLCVSPLGRQVAALHASGGISVWDVPSLRKRKFWSLENQPGFDHPDTTSYAKLSQKEGFSAPSLRNHLADVKWWSEKAVTLARFSGAVTVCSVHSLANLLGESPEFFEGVPQISETYDRCFLGLEMERTLLKSDSRSLLNLSESGEGDESLLEEVDLEEGDLSLLEKAKLMACSLLFWITDAERFRPSNKRPQVVSRTCRLLCLKSTTPLELFSRKIENEEYGEALLLAHRYNLDCDLVYQQQWRKSPVTVATIQDYLSKIRKRSWVLDECLSRVPDDVDAARELILYGLRGTELDTLVGIAEGTNEDEFLVSDLSLDYEEDLDMDPEEAERDAEAWAAKDLHNRRELLSKIDFHNLSKEQIEVVRARQNLLKYFDRLSSYEVLLGGPHTAPERYEATFYEKFRNQTEIEAAVELARAYDWRGVEVLFTYHGDATLPHRLAILSNFPPTMGPYEYRSLLPECDLSGEVFEWEQDFLRDPDWCEDSLCRKAVGLEEDIGLSLLYDGQPHLETFRQVELTSQLVSEWYRLRATWMEESSHFVDAALDLLKLGRERNVMGLEDLQNTFDTLEVLVYEVGLSQLSLKNLQDLSDLEKLKLLMSTSTSETHIQNLRRWGQAFLSHCEDREKGLGKRLLREFVVCTARQDLGVALKTIQHSQQDMTDPIFIGSEEVLKVALDSIYECERENQLPRAFAILECLPVSHPESDSPELSELHSLVDALEDHLGAAELLSSNGVQVTPSFVRKVQGDQGQVQMMLTRLARSATRREASFTESDWNKLLSDMLEMQQKVFSAVEPQVCFEILTEALLTSGVREYIDFAGELLETKADASPVRNPYLQKLPYGVAVKLVLKAATEYFNSSESYSDSDMSLARHCLNMIGSDNDRVATELDLISSLEMLPELGIEKLPLQVRVCEDRLGLLSEALSKRPSLYRLGSKLLRLSALLRVCGRDERQRKAKVLTVVAEAAFKLRDMEAANSWCLQLVKGGHGEGWEICSKVGRCEGAKDGTLRAKFLDFALTHAPYEHLEGLLDARNEVELSLLYSRVSDRIQPNVSLDSDDGFEDARSESGEESCEEWEDPSPSPPVSSLPSNRLLLNVTRNVLSATASSTSSFVSSVANKRMWKSAIGWLRPLRPPSSKGTKGDPNDEDGNSAYTKQGCHAFYADICPDAYISKLGTTYRSYGPPSIANPALDLSFTLLRIALIEESRCNGNTVQTNVTVLQELVKGVLQEDLLLGLSFLLLLSTPSDVKDVLSSLPRTEVSLQVCLYYYALQIYTCLHPWRKPGIAPVFLHPPGDVIACVRSLLEEGEVPEEEEEEEGEGASSYAAFFRSTDRLAGDFSQGQALRRLDAGVDVERFLAEEDYKKDTVLGLAMTSDPTVVDLALSLARRYAVPLFEVRLTHLQFLFDASDVTTEDLRRRLRERGVVALLKEEDPGAFVSALQDRVMGVIDGRDHDRLALCFGLVAEASEDQSKKMSATSHVRVLGQLKGVASSLDYKALLRSSSSALDVLKPVLTKENVDVLAEAAQSLPTGGESALTPSRVYCAWAQKHFFDLSGRRKPKTANEWIKRFEETKEILKKLRAQDVNLLIRCFVFSEEALTRVPLEARAEMIKRAAKYCDTKSSETESEAESQEWTEAFSKLTKLESHLELLRSGTFQNLSNSSDPALKEYAHQFMLSGGDEECLEKLSRRVLLRLGSLDALRSLLSVFPEDAAQSPEDIFLDVFKQTLVDLSKGHRKPDDEGECDSFQLFSHLLKELDKYCEEGGDILDQEEVLDEVRSFAQDEEIPLETRVRIMSISQQFLPLNESDNRLLQAMKTGGIVQEVFSSPSKESQGKKEKVAAAGVDTEAGRRDLLKTLIDKMDSVKKAKSIVELLNIWPKFESEIYTNVESNPWLRVLLKLLRTSKLKGGSKDCLDLIYTSTKYCIEEEQMNEECISELASALLETESPSGDRIKTALKITLRASHLIARDRVIEKYKRLTKIEESHYDEELLKLIVEAKLVSKVLPTCLYGPLVSYLSEEENIGLRRSVVNELEASNHWIEAASLAVYSSSVPRALKTASSAVKTFRNWL